jgi:hypothetical protein
MLDQIVGFTIPAAFALLPEPMRTIEARALLVTIGLQESGFRRRRQEPGSARGFWQFEVNGIQGVLDHDRTQLVISRVLAHLHYDHTQDARDLHPFVEHNDTLACCFARCLLWTSLDALPTRAEKGGAARSFALYRTLWRPGKPKASTWGVFYEQGWSAWNIESPAAIAARKG